MICTCTLSSAEAGDNFGFDANDVAAPWCDNPATTTIPLNFGQRVVHAWVCQIHADEYIRMMDAA